MLMWSCSWTSKPAYLHKTQVYTPILFQLGASETTSRQASVRLPRRAEGWDGPRTVRSSIATEITVDGEHTRAFVRAFVDLEKPDWAERFLASACELQLREFITEITDVLHMLTISFNHVYHPFKLSTTDLSDQLLCYSISLSNWNK
jgi:hypothetical protein